jgi:hypothetical protein
MLQTAREIAALQQKSMRGGYPLLPPETVLRRLQPAAPQKARQPSYTVIANGHTLATGRRRPDGGVNIALAAPLPADHAVIHAATTEILNNLCVTEKGCQKTTLSAIATSSPAHAQAA